MKTKIIHHPTHKKSIRCAKELQGLLPFESDLHAGCTRFSLPRDDYIILDKDEWDENTLSSNPVLLSNRAACFYAHYSIWETLTENTLILEDDARQIHPFDISVCENFDGDVLNLGDPVYCGKANEEAVQELRSTKYNGVKRRTYEGSFLYGAHAYVLTPKGAEKLLRVSDHGRLLRPNDVMCQVGIVDLFDYFPYAFHQDQNIRRSIILDPKSLFMGK